MSLLDQVQELPSYAGTKSRRRWAEYVEPYFTLISKGYPKAEACRKLAELTGLTADEAEKLHRASKNWKQPNA